MSRKLLVCMQHRSGPGASCGARHGGGLLESLQQALHEAGLDVAVEPINCFVKCEQGPNIKLMPDGRFWHRSTPETLQEIVAYLRQQQH